MKAPRDGLVKLPDGSVMILDGGDMWFYFKAVLRTPIFEMACDLAIEERDLTDWSKCAHKVPKRPSC